MLNMKWHYMLLQITILHHICLGSIDSTITCKSLRGNTPWFLIIKPPQSVETLYADKSKPYLYRHETNVDQKSNPLEMTTRPIYFPELAPQPLNYFMYNDAVPGGETSFYHGHTKGVVMFDNTSLVMIVHSTPHFPYNDSSGYGFPETGKRYAQHFFCITMPLVELSTVLKSVRMMWPFVYNYKIDSNLYNKYPDLKAIVEGLPFTIHDVAASSQSLTVQLVDETIITIYTKNATFGADIYDGLISTSFRPPISLYTETWQNGYSKLHSNCTKDYFVKNIKYINFYAQHLNFTETHDHSKWAISASHPELVCFGGVNRMKSQFHRGGGTFCFVDKILWKFLDVSIGAVEECLNINLTE